MVKAFDEVTLATVVHDRKVAGKLVSTLIVSHGLLLTSSTPAWKASLKLQELLGQLGIQVAR